MRQTTDRLATRSQRYGDAVRTYRDPELHLRMLEGLHHSFGRLRVLDLAAGQGDATRHLRAIDADITYVDSSDSMLRRGIARGQIPPDRAVRHDATHLPLPLPSHQFDIAVIRYAFHDFADQVALLREVRRLLVPGGCLQIVDMSSESEPAVALMNHIQAWKHREPQPALANVISVSTHTSQARLTGYQVISLGWYQSRVDSRDWVREGQITSQRHSYLRATVAAMVADAPQLADSFHIDVRSRHFTISFPVMILTLRASRGSTDE